jgi:hypothetical protein
MAITINIKNKKALSILKSLEDINFIEIEKQHDASLRENREEQQHDKNDLFRLKGIWKNRDVDINVIRDKAWRRE